MRAEIPGCLDIEETLGSTGFGVVATGHRSWVVTSNRRPAAGRLFGALGLLVAGAGLPLLGLRRSRFATLLLHEGAGASWVEIDGSLAAAVVKTLEEKMTEDRDVLAAPAASNAVAVEAAAASAASVESPSFLPPPVSTPTWTPPRAEYDDQTTMLGAKVAALRQESGGVLRLVFDTGEVVVVDREVLVGRAPTGGTDVRIVPINDPEGSVSKLHFVLRQATGVTWIRDNGSTNGTGLIRQGGALEELTAGAPTPLSAGDTIVFGRRRATVSDG